MGEYIHSDITGKVISAAMAVHRTLGPGFLEKVYEKALALELQHRQVKYQRQVEYVILYREEEVGTHKIDMIVEGKVIVELKSVDSFAPEHTSVVLSYLSTTKLSIALLMNFAKPRLEYKRIISRSLNDPA